MGVEIEQWNKSRMTYQRIIERKKMRFFRLSLLTSKVYDNGNDDRVVIDFTCTKITKQSLNKTTIKPPSSSGLRNTFNNTNDNGV